MKGKETVHIPWMDEMSYHQRSLLVQKETQYQLATALCPGKDKRMIFKNIMVHFFCKLSQECKFGSHLKMNKKN